MQTHYEVLGVIPSADLEEIKAAYRQKARELHPDTGEEDASKFAKCAEAYKTLSDSTQRRQYDKYLRFILDACPVCKGSGASFKFRSFSVVVRERVNCGHCNGRGYHE